MAKIDIYPSTLPGAPLESHSVNGGTFADWLKVNCPSFVEGEKQPVSVFVNGVMVLPSQWCQLSLSGDVTLEVRPNPRGGIPVAIWIIGAVLATAVVVTALRPNIPSARTRGMGVQGEQLSGADIKANTPRLNGTIPEIAGRFRIYPDYLNQPRRYFTSPTNQSIDTLLCVGTGEYSIPADQIRIGETPIQDLTELADYTIFEPGQNVTSHPAHRNWYNAPEVGSSAGSSGLRLVSGASGTPQAEATQYRIDGDSISIPQGAGIAPQDWEVNNIVSIIARTRSITVVDAGGSNRDFVRGSFADLNLSVNDDLFIVGAGGNDGRYKVHSINTSVNQPGTPSTIVGTRVAELEFFDSPANLSIKGFDITLDQDYTDHDDLVSAINSQIGGATVTHNSGVLTVTELSPFSGFFIQLSGFYELILGASPNMTVGIKTDSFDELRLDKFFPSGFAPASAMNPGTFNAVDVYRTNNYRITSLITGPIPGGTGTVGFEFQRLNPDGSNDASWTGFAVETTTPNVLIRLDSSQVVGGWLGPFKATPANEPSDLIEFDIFCPSGVGFINRDSGAVEARTKFFEAQWRTGSGAWNPIQYSFSGATRDQVGFTYQIQLPSSLPNLEIRIRRIGAEDTGLEALDRIEWYGLKTLLPAPSSYAGVTTIALTLAGSDKISNKSENQINMIVNRRLNGQNTRSIAQWIRYVCSTVGYSPQDINEDELGPLEALWTARGDFFDLPFAGQTTVKEVLQTALRAGFAEFTIDRGQIRPVRDQPRTTFEHMYSAQNMTEPLKRYFTAFDPDDFDGVDVEYTSSTTWEQETVQCRLPGDQGVKVEKIRLDGVTSRTRAWRIGMRQRRIQQFRRKTFNFSTEWDALNSRYMSFCAVADDVPGYGQSALVAAFKQVAGGYVIESTEPLKFEQGKTHVLALRRPDGTLAGPYPATQISEYETQISGVLDFVPITRGAVEPTHLIFGTVETWSYPVLVTEISPSGTDKVDVTAVNYDNRVYADDDNSPT